MAAALDEEQEPEPDESLGWQPVWKRLRKPKSKAEKKQELRKQRRRLQRAGRRRLAAGQPRPEELGFGSGMTCRRRLAVWNEAGVWDQLGGRDPGCRRARRPAPAKAGRAAG
ncbi:hypothetical protein [Streptomyces sp. NPDC003032]